MQFGSSLGSACFTRYIDVVVVVAEASSLVVVVVLLHGSILLSYVRIKDDFHIICRLYIFICASLYL
jgi:hypothetical protein